MLSLGLLLPLGAGTATDGVAKSLATFAAPAKHVTLVRDGSARTIETHAATPDELLAENGIARAPEDALSVDPASSLTDGETVEYRAALPVTLVVDGQPRSVRTTVKSVRDLLAQQHVDWDGHDRVSPAPQARLAAAQSVVVRHVNMWTEAVRTRIAYRVVKRWAFDLKRGRVKVVDAGTAGIREADYAISRSPDRRSTRRTLLVTRVIRAPKARIVAEGIGEYEALTKLAQRGVSGTLRLAGSALSMIATAYTADCGGCSGTTASGTPAGRGVVAVDPSVIPMGTKLFIPGYGRAVAGDTGGAIRGRRIDLGFDSLADALSFGRRAVTVYFFK